jgi:hypothetical protein
VVCIVQQTRFYLSLDEMTDPHFGHDGDGNRLDDLLDHVWVALEMEKREKRKVPEGICSSNTMHGDEASHLPYARHRLRHEYLQAHALVP